MRVLLSLMFVILAVAMPVSAQIVNGDFSAPLGWTIASSPPVTVYYYSGFGLPAPSAYFSSVFGSQTGFASISQTFQCGDGGSNGTCVIAFDYFMDVSGATVKIEAIVDGTTQYTATRTTDTPGWEHAGVNVDCGQRALTIKVTCTAAGTFDYWTAYVDNVTGTCEVPVPTDPSTWGRVKALFR